MQHTRAGGKSVPGHSLYMHMIYIPPLLHLQNKELDATKDNLKNFIVRWETHPNSPYVFDVEGNVIAPLNETSYPHPRRGHGPDSISSSRGEYGSQRQRDRHALIHGK